ncbi:MAG: hypothetical protein KAX49_16220 [Halanaerobiales bacterium]|nr:hypothetical protein [Halanaerobiales bacterium]
MDELPYAERYVLWCGSVWVGANDVNLNFDNFVIFYQHEAGVKGVKVEILSSNLTILRSNGFRGKELIIIEFYGLIKIFLVSEKNGIYKIRIRMRVD